MKENIRTVKSSDELSENNKILEKILEMHKIKKELTCIKMIDISKKTYENNDIDVIVDDDDTLWLNEKHIEEKLGHKNLPIITNKYDPVYKKHRH